ncbi:hypothetical protein PybrP1_004885 [[Pythium] brassicae (nom. inval.)]|nr:hypothetical protein PybrP1_004885 [[Pythium] brassicae (nom. inval.)]
MSLNVNKVVPDASPSLPSPLLPTGDAGSAPGQDGDDDDRRSADGSKGLPQAGGSGRPKLQPLQRPPRTIDRAKMNVRRGSKHLKQLFNVKPDTDLDLDTYYQKRLRRRTLLQHEIASTLLSGGLAAGGDDILEELASSPSMMRSMRITLSPGEEYENYQKVNAASSKAVLSPFASTASLIDDDDENLHGAGSKPTVKLEDVAEETVDDLQRRATLFTPDPADGVVAESLANPRATGAASAFSAATAAAAPPKRLHRMRSVTGKSTIVHHVSRMVNPLGRFRLAWDVVSIAFIFYNAFAIPFDVSFNAETNDTYFDTLVDIFFVVDIVMTFNTAVDVDGSIRYDRRLAATLYLNSWFAVDVIAALPYAYMVSQSSATSSAAEDTGSLVKLLKLLRLVRLLRLFRISRILRRIQNAVFIRSTLSSLLKYCMLVTFVSHWFSCVFHGIGAAHDGGANWISAQGLDEPSAGKWDRYVCALYFAVQTLATIGFGDVSGTNADERLFGIFAMIMGGGIFAYGITNIVELVSSLTIQETRFRQKMDERKGAQIGILGENQYFGEMAILSPDSRRTASVRTLCFCELRMLSRNRFLEALSLYPAMQTKMAHVARVRATTAGNPQAVPLKDTKDTTDRVREPKMTTLPSTVSAQIPPSVSPPPLEHGDPHKPAELDLVRQFTLLPQPPLEATPTSTHLSLGTSATSSLARIQQAERRMSGPFIPIRATMSSRLSGAARRSSNAPPSGISPAMALVISDITLMLEEAMRRQELLVRRVVRLKSGMDQLKLDDESPTARFSSSSQSLDT